MNNLKRIRTGIKGFDELIGGGFIENKVYLVSGESGTGKTVFGLQYLLTGLAIGENGIYISGDEKPEHLVVDAESMGWKFSSYIKDKKLGLLDISPYFKEIKDGKIRDVDVRTIVADLTKHVKQINAKRIVIDPVAPLIFRDECQAGLREYVRDLVFAMEDNLGCTILLTSGIPTGSALLSRHGVAEFVTEGTTILSIRKRGEHNARTLQVRKMRCSQIDVDDHVFDIVSGKGIAIRGALPPA